jgi:hypothetical protein
MKARVYFIDGSQSTGVELVWRYASYSKRIDKGKSGLVQPGRTRNVSAAIYNPGFPRKGAMIR